MAKEGIYRMQRRSARLNSSGRLVRGLVEDRNA
jgi:hypothetical protein